MSALTEFLFAAPAARKAGAILRWWEKRRLTFNLMVGAAGLFSLAFMQVVTRLPPHAHRPPTSEVVPVIVVFGVLANFCYLLGPTVEIALDRVWGRSVLPTGPTLFRMGLTFSVGLALLPTLIVCLDWGFRVMRALF
jgi:hypothetical protein